MSPIKHPSRPGRASSGHQAGSFVVEFSLLVLLFFIMVFFVIEMARLVYMWNTLVQVSRDAARAAATTDFSDSVALSSLRQKAIFRANAGSLVLGAPITDDYVRVDYMSIARAADGSLTATPIPTGMLPSCPARNRLICAANPNNASCIQLVRVRFCDPANASGCDAIPYRPVSPLTSLAGLNLPTTTTIMKAESLGYSPGMSMCP